VCKGLLLMTNNNSGLSTGIHVCKFFLSLPTEEVDSTIRSLKMNRRRSSQMVGFIINK
jgi:hypothetical protein